MKIKSFNNGIQIRGLTDFNPQHIFECGQAFRWDWDGQGYCGVVEGKVIRTLWDGQTLFLENTTHDDFSTIWKNYFDLETDYKVIKATLSVDPIMEEAIKYGWGIRILKQDPWETLISFIISANNGIKRIKGILTNLSKKYGEKIIWQGNEYYSFPFAESLAQASENGLRECGCGYRAPYIKKTAALVNSGKINLADLKNMKYMRALEVLLQCPGVGPKVADCVLLFSLDKSQAFPVDVWIQRIVENLYFKNTISQRDVREFANKQFGPLAGYAQQYLFYYAREKQIGK